MRFRVQLDDYAGPFDLLWYLVRKHELDVLAIPITRIADQYLDVLAALEQIDVDAVGDFLDVASRLMELKARMMLPHREEVEEQQIEESRQDLVAQLLEYKRYRDAAGLLEEQSRQWQLRYSRRVNDLDDAPLDPAEQPIQEVELWDLLSAFGRVLRQRTAAKTARIRHDETPIEHYMRQIVDRLAATPRLPFAELFPEDGTRGQFVGLFLALLELIRHGQAAVDQGDPFGEICILAPAPAVADGEHPSA